MYLIPKSETARAHELTPKGKPWCGAHITGGIRSEDDQGRKICDNCFQAKKGRRRVLITSKHKC